MPLRSYNSYHLDEDVVLKEVSKKYILIPKHTTTVVEPKHAREISSASDSSDWKSKYDILTQLKNDETGIFQPKLQTGDLNKEGSVYQSPALNEHIGYVEIPERDSNVKAESDQNKVHFQDNYDYDTKNTGEEFIIYTDENTNLTFNDNHESVDINKAAISDDRSGVAKQSFELPDEIDVQISNTKENDSVYVEETEKDVDDVIYANVSKKCASGTVKVDDIKELNKNVAYTAPEPEQIEKANLSNNIENYESNESHDNSQEPYAADSNNHVTEEVSETKTAQDYENINYEHESIHRQTLDSENHPESDAKPATHETSDLKDGNLDTSELPVNVINAEDFNPDLGVISFDGDAHPPYEESALQYQSKIPEEVTNTVDVSQINDFDQENREMFYSEEQNANYQEYNSEQQEYAGPTAEETAQGAYDENGQFVYYEGGTQDQVYPVEYAENEAVNQPYDQAYEQQYASDNYGVGQYEQGQYDQQQYEQPEQPHIYENVEQYGGLQNDGNVSVDEVQQQLDNEQGYVEAQPAVQNVVGELANVEVADNPAEMSKTPESGDTDKTG